jgi:hypothetical protein
MTDRWTLQTERMISTLHANAAEIGRLGAEIGHAKDGWQRDLRDMRGHLRQAR